KTRSGLLWECERIIKHKKPKYLLMENVKHLVSKKFKADFDEWVDELKEIGYTTYWAVLNSKHFGIPQNRERVFAVSILGDHTLYQFPQKRELKKVLKDFLQEDVDDKFYLRKDLQERFIFKDEDKFLAEQLELESNNENEIKDI